MLKSRSYRALRLLSSLGMPLCLRALQDVRLSSVLGIFLVALWGNEWIYKCLKNLETQDKFILTINMSLFLYLQTFKEFYTLIYYTSLKLMIGSIILILKVLLKNVQRLMNIECIIRLKITSSGTVIFPGLSTL